MQAINNSNINKILITMPTDKVLKKFSKQDFGKYNMVMKEAIERIKKQNFSEKIFYVCSFFIG